MRKGRSRGERRQKRRGEGKQQRREMREQSREEEESRAYRDSRWEEVRERQRVGGRTWRTWSRKCPARREVDPESSFQR